MKINLNDTVKVKLTEYGKESITSSIHPTLEKGYNTFHLWELMNIFGRCLYMGNTKIPFEKNEIYFEENNKMEYVHDGKDDAIRVIDLYNALSKLIEDERRNAKVLFNKREVKYVDLVTKNLTEPDKVEMFLVLTDE